MSGAEEYQLNPYFGLAEGTRHSDPYGFLCRRPEKSSAGFLARSKRQRCVHQSVQRGRQRRRGSGSTAGRKDRAAPPVFDESVMIVEGQGATSMWYEDGRKNTFEWQQGSVFAIPPNVWHQHYAMSVSARLVSCTSAPLYMQLFNNNDFIFNCDYKFLRPICRGRELLCRVAEAFTRLQGDRDEFHRRREAMVHPGECLRVGGKGRF